MTPETEIDVVILSWNRIEETIEAIDSVLAQEGVAAQCHVVDQGSDAEKLDVLRAYCERHPTVHLEELGRNVGVPAGRNIATRLGTAPLVVGLDNDAEFDGPGMLAEVVRLFAGDPNLGAIGFRILVHSTGEDDFSSFGYPSHLWEGRDRPFRSANFIGAGHAYRRDTFEAAQGYDESLFFCWEELDFGHRIINTGYTIRYEPQVVIRHKVSPEARVRWDGGRYYYTVRNRIFIEHKAGMPAGQMVQMVGGMGLRALRNGLVWDTLRGIFDAGKMAIGHRPDKERRAVERLKPDVRAFLDDFYRRGEYTTMERFRRAIGTRFG
ncbi:MAG: glycosyltransferase [Pseudomonadota bacterium]